MSIRELRAINTLVKRPDEDLERSIEFSPWLSDFEFLDGTPIITPPADSDLSFIDIEIFESQVQFLITGGVARPEPYVVVVTVDVGGGDEPQVMQAECLVGVRESVSAPLRGNTLPQYLVRGDSYLSDQDRSLDFFRSDFPDIPGGSTVRLTARRHEPATPAASFAIVGSIVEPAGTKRVRFEPATEESRQWEPGIYGYDVEIEFPDGNVATFAGPGSSLRVVRDVTINS